jgi:selenocysteine-specific elongation factor
MALDGLIVERGSELALPAHQPNLSPDQQVAIEALIKELQKAPFAPPPLPELTGRYPLTPALLQYLVASGRIVRVNDDTIFAAKAYQEAVERLTAHLQREGKVTVAQARDLLGSSRRYVLPLLEWLDTQKVTRRVGDDRILRV